MDIATCKHFNGTMNTHCDAGVCYRDVTTDPDNINGVALRKPCIDWNVWHSLHKSRKPLNEDRKAEFDQHRHCDKREAPTVEEVEAHEIERDARFKEYIDNIQNNICPTHKIQITKRQVGRCVYAEPCGCRLYQGKI